MPKKSSDPMEDKDSWCYYLPGFVAVSKLYIGSLCMSVSVCVSGTFSLGKSRSLGRHDVQRGKVKATKGCLTGVSTEQSTVK